MEILRAYSEAFQSRFTEERFQQAFLAASSRSSDSESAMEIDIDPTSPRHEDSAAETSSAFSEESSQESTSFCPPASVICISPPPAVVAEKAADSFRSSSLTSLSSSSSSMLAKSRCRCSERRSSSSCLSLLSESDFFDEPSTSGCSSEMASMAATRAKKRQKVKEFLRELKSMVPREGAGSKVGTLSTLDYVVSSMRKITEEHKQDKSQLFKAPSSEPVALPSFQCSESVDFRNVNDGVILTTQSELTVAVSLKNHVVLSTSTALMDLLGYPNAWWKGRLLKDFVHKKDVMTVNSYINNKSAETDSSAARGGGTNPKKGQTKDTKNKFFYARIRRFRNLPSGFSIGTAPSHVYFKVMVTLKSPDSAPDISAEEQKMSRRCMMLYFAPMVSPYKDGQLPPEPEQRTFSLRHSLFCQYTYTHANTVALLGFLPQDIVGTSIFDYYHPDDMPQLLDIYKKVMHSMGQPFKSGSLRMRTQNGTYVRVQTEWSSFTNPWDHKLEFIIAQHTVLKAPDNPNVFEEPSEERQKFPDGTRKLVNKIIDVLKRPMSLDNMPPTPSDTTATVSHNASASSVHEMDIGSKPKDKAKNDGSAGPTSPSQISSSLMDEKSISSLYNQLNYSLNIKRFLLSHPKCFPVSDEDSSTDVVAKDDSEEEMNEEEEMQVEIPVVRPPSCGSSTQVHVSEPGFHEEIPSPPSFHEDMHLKKEAIDNQLVLTEDSLRKHTKAQELLYLQEASLEQPHLFHLRQQKLGTRRQKRSRPSGHEETDVFKFARGSKGQRGQNPTSGAGLFLPNFPMTTVDIKPTTSQPTTTSVPPHHPTNIMGMMPGHFQPRVGVMPQLTMLPVDPTGMHLQPFLPTPGSSMQWPYYPQSGYSLLPQVMAGFYQQVLQPMPLTPVTSPSPFTTPPLCTTKSSDMPLQSGPNHVQSFPSLTKTRLSCLEESDLSELDEHIQSRSTCPNTRHSHSMGSRPWDCMECRKVTLVKEQQKNVTDSDNPPSSMEDTSSSIQYLLDAVCGNGSSPNEEIDEKMQQQKQQRQVAKLPRRRPTVPPWLQGINWTPEVRMMYKMPVPKLNNVLKKDREALKKTSQSEQSRAQLEELLEDLEMPDHMLPFDEEADYLFFPECEEQDGEQTPQLDSPPVSFDLGNAEAEDFTNIDVDEPLDKPVEVIFSGEEPEKTQKEKADRTETMESASEQVPVEKVHSLGSQGSKDGSAGSATSPTPPLSSEGKNDGTAMETNKSAKDSGGSWSDEASDKGSDKGSENSSNHTHKAEDEQSFTSKVSSSDLTPSDERSTEDASSSLKESDMSTPKGSFVSSNDKLSTDSGAESVPTPKPDFYEKLFVPMKVLMCKSRGVFGGKEKMAPFWQIDAHMSRKISMQYNLTKLSLSTVLENDRRRLASMCQPRSVNYQLLELLQETDTPKGKVTGAGEVTEKSETEINTASGNSKMECDEATAKQLMASRPNVTGAKPDDTRPKVDDSQPRSAPSPAVVEKQLLEKLQGMTQGHHSDFWPGDIIMNKVFLPSDLSQSGSMPAPEVMNKSLDSEILDTVD